MFYRRIIRAYKFVVKDYFNKLINKNTKSDANAFYEFLTNYLKSTFEMFQESNGLEELRKTIGYITYLVKRKSSENFINRFPNDIFDEEELDQMIEDVNEYNEQNSRKMSSINRAKMLNHSITRVGKYLCEVLGESKPFWQKIRYRKGIVIENEEKFMAKIDKAINRIKIAY